MRKLRPEGVVYGKEVRKLYIYTILSLKRENFDTVHVCLMLSVRKYRMEKTDV